MAKKGNGKPLDLTTKIEKRQTEDSLRLATELVAVATAVNQVRDLLRDQRLEQFEKKIA